MKYIYNVELEAFRREDRKGKPLYVNIIEANRIISLLNLGHSVAEINGKVSLSNPKGTVTTINSFIRNYNEGNIEIPENAPTPVHNLESLSDSSRIDRLEKRVTDLENIISEIKSDCFCTCFAGESSEEKSITDKVKSWLVR